MKKSYVHTFLLLILWGMSNYTVMAQTLVKMEMPPQAEKEFSVHALFSDAIPKSSLVVLGALGYDIEGGTKPYTLNWYEGETIIATGDIAIFTPNNGSVYSLKINDTSNCSKTIAINIDALKNLMNQLNPEKKAIVSISPTLVTNYIDIQRITEGSMSISIQITDLQGNIQKKTQIDTDTTVPIHLPSGIYLLIIRHKDMVQVEKIVVV